MCRGGSGHGKVEACTRSLTVNSQMFLNVFLNIEKEKKFKVFVTVTSQSFIFFDWNLHEILLYKI